KLQTELAELREAMAMPVVLVTHDLTEAQLLADQVCVLHRGKTLQQGPVEHVMRAPASARVARLLDQRNLFSATVTAQNEEEGWTELDWFDRPLRCRYSDTFRPGDSVAWLVPRGYVRMHRPDHPSSGDDENAVSGEIIELVVLGDEVQIAMTVEGVEGTLSFSVAVPVAERNALAKGVPVSVSLIAEGIHLMAAE
ncbi:MAG: ABC transporter, partial [Gammaproteobacteria bacterium]